MKKLLLLLILLSCNFTVFAQLSLEATYSRNTLNRVKLEISGEKYYLYDDLDKTVKLYNADHTFWKSIPLQFPGNPLYVFVSSVSETTINPDNNIEIVYSFHNPTETRVISEDGTLLKTIPGLNSLQLVHSLDGSAKLMGNYINNTVSPVIFTGVVYAVPSLTLEHTYSEGEVKRIILENSGEKYYVFDKINGMLKIFNTDHGLWKNIALPKSLESSYLNFLYFSETIHPDAQLEIGYGFQSGANSIVKIINESSSELLSVPDASGSMLSRIDGLEDKIIVYKSSATATHIYSVPGMVLEHTYPEVIRRTKLDLSGEKYFTANISGQTTTKIYNSDHSLWKTITFPTGSLYPNDITHISQNMLNADDKVEIIYACETPFFTSTSVLINDDGSMYQQLGLVIGLSEIPGLAPKFLGQSAFQGVQGSYSEVYTIDFLSTQEFNLEKLLVYPNPTKSFLNFDSEKAILEVAIYDSRGVLVKTISDGDFKTISVQDLSSGIYFAQLTTSDNSKSVHKFIVSK